MAPSHDFRCRNIMQGSDGSYRVCGKAERDAGKLERHRNGIPLESTGGRAGKKRIRDGGGR